MTWPGTYDAAQTAVWKSLRVPQEFQWEWLTIPHLYASPFYCYAYSFGNLLVLALYRMYQEQGAAFVPSTWTSWRPGVESTAGDPGSGRCGHELPRVLAIRLRCDFRNGRSAGRDHEMSDRQERRV